MFTDEKMKESDFCCRESGAGHTLFPKFANRRQDSVLRLSFPSKMPADRVLRWGLRLFLFSDWMSFANRMT